MTGEDGLSFTEAIHETILHSVQEGTEWIKLIHHEVGCPAYGTPEDCECQSWRVSVDEAVRLGSKTLAAKLAPLVGEDDEEAAD